MRTSYEKPSMMAIELTHRQMLCDSTVIEPGEDNEQPGVREEHHFNSKSIWEEEW